MSLPARASFDPWLILFAVMALTVSLWAAWAVDPVRKKHLPRRQAMREFAMVMLIGGGIAAALAGSVWAVLPPLACFLGIAAIFRLFARRLSMPGVAWLTVEFGGLSVGWAWACLFLGEIELPAPLRMILLGGMTASLGIALLGCIERIAREAVLTHEHWQVPRRAPLGQVRKCEYPVSIHLPCYAEPPEVVKETMNRLAALDYHNFEVLVCDNNTQDPALWRPLKTHCSMLNAVLGRECFRFFHQAPLPGAKAGALNFCLEQMDRRTEIVAVIDADYYSRPDFLARLVPLFEDPRVGYVQTPHDYRDYEGNAYLTGSYWEYMPNNKVDMPGVSEYGGAFTIGTMCLLRANVLRNVGGWAEWCLTEDSEVSVRLREAGYRGIYLRETFGRGLIPDTFDDYKKQRFRWTAGPVQQLRRHWRLFLPSPWASPMPGWTKLLEVLRCIAPLQTLAALLFGLAMLGALVVAAAIGAMPPIDLPPIVWVLLGFGTLTWLVRTWHRYRLSDCRRMADMVRGEIARASLSWVVLVAGVAGLSGKPLAWRRTPKFGAGGTGELARLRGAIETALPETVAGIAALCLAGAVLFALQRLGQDIALLAAGGLAMLGLRFLAAPYMAALAVIEARKATPAPLAGEPAPMPVNDNERLAA